MKYRTRTYYTDAQKALMWERWKEGWTLHQIAQLFDRAHTSVQGILSRTGGIRPPARSRCATTLTLAEREQISRAMVEGQSIRSVASRLGRAPSTVSREIQRNGGQSDSRATEADSAGRRNKSPDGSSILIRATRTSTCRTRPSTAACSFNRVVP
jgi:hypothetical protein